ncbi:hypothetical protein ACWEGE_38660 [Amycolatopsis sp. NPDC004747]
MSVLLGFRPGWVVMGAMSYTAAVASVSRAESSAAWMPWRRCASVVAAPGELRDAGRQAQTGATGEDAAVQCRVAGHPAAAQSRSASTLFLQRDESPTDTWRAG